MITRAFAKTAAALAVVALLAAACTGTGTGTGSTDAEGGALRIGAMSLPPGLGDPYASSLSGSAVKNVLPAIFDRLTQVTADGVDPALATSWAQSDDRLSWDFELRQGVQFSNGEPLDSEAVVKSFDYLLDGGGKTSLVAGYFADLEKVEAVDEDTVRFTTKSANPALPRDVTQVFIVPPKYFAEVGADKFATAPIGTGPYEAVSWSSEKIVFKPTENSWRKPTFPGVTFQALPDTTAREQALQSGQIDLALSLPAGLANELEGTGASYKAAPQGTVLALQFVNTKGKTPLNDVRVRKALNMAINREEIIDSILIGESSPANQGAVKGALGYVADMEEYPFDPVEAKKMLTEAGYPNGFKFTAQLSGEAGDTPDIMQATAGYLEKIGVTMNVQDIPFSQWLEKLQTNGFESTFSIGYTSQPDFNSLRAYRASSCLNKTAFWCDDDDEQTRLLQAADAASSIKEFEPAMAAIGRWTHDNPPSLFLLELVEFVGISDAVSAVEFNPMGGLDLDKVTPGK